MGGRFRRSGFGARGPYVYVLFAHPMVIMILDVGLSCGESWLRVTHRKWGSRLHQSGATLSGRAFLILPISYKLKVVFNGL